MLRLIGLVISIGLADSVNPSTIAPAMYLAAGAHPRRQVAEFTLAVFGVYLVGGLAIALGPGQLLLSLVPRPGRHVTNVLEIAAGVAMFAGAALLWSYRRRLGRLEPPQVKPGSRSGALLGATITAIELPTAFPYFAAIAAIVSADLDIVRVVVLMVIFNACFVVPLLGVLGTLVLAGPDAQRVLARGRARLEAHWPTVLAGLALLAGAIAILLGATGLAASHHGHLGVLSRRVRRAMHLHP